MARYAASQTADMEGDDSDAMSADSSDEDAQWMEDIAATGCLPMSAEGGGFQGTQLMVVPWVRDGRLHRFSVLRSVGSDHALVDVQDWTCVKFDIGRVGADAHVVRSLRRTDSGCLFWQYAKHLAQGLDAKLTLEQIAESFRPKLLTDKYSKSGPEPELPSAIRDVLLYWSRRLADRPAGMKMFEA
jgi:hypothetical protein